MKAPFPIDSRLTGIAIAYRNQEMIADSVLPRVDVASDPFKYQVYNKGDRFQMPDTLVGRKGAPNQVEFGATEVEAATNDYGLDDSVPQHDIDRGQAANLDPLGNATEGIMDLVALGREARTSALVFALASYPTANRTTLSGTTQWSDKTNSTPIVNITSALDVPIARPNVAVFGRATWTALATHPHLVKAFNGSSGDTGIITRQFFAELFELEEVLVGQAFVNTAKKGQAPVFARAWGKHAAFIHRNKLATNQRGVTFGYTAQFGSRVAGSFEDKDIGLRGGQRVRAGESLKELICANDVGYFFENAVA